MLYRLHTGRAYEAIERLATTGGSENQIARGAEARRPVGFKGSGRGQRTSDPVERRLVLGKRSYDRIHPLGRQATGNRFLASTTGAVYFAVLTPTVEAPDAVPKKQDGAKA
jgi:hypothetical protein